MAKRASRRAALPRAPMTAAAAPPITTGLLAPAAPPMTPGPMMGPGPAMGAPPMAAAPHPLDVAMARAAILNRMRGMR